MGIGVGDGGSRSVISGCCCGGGGGGGGGGVCVSRKETLSEW